MNGTSGEKCNSRSMIRYQKIERELDIDGMHNIENQYWCGRVEILEN